MGRLIKYAVIAICAFSFGYFHYKYVSNIFESHNNFSHLSNLEREMVLRTEMGFYYSYYKTIVEEHPFIAGVTKLMYDKLVEYPKEVNALNRFNVHPEVIIGAAYRYLEPYLNDSSKSDCHIVDRGCEHGMVESCTGLGQPIIFYLEAVWWLAGLTVTALFLHAVSLSGSITGGVISMVHYFANHAECTRVQWAPNERENMAVPFLMLQGWLLTLQLRDANRRSAFPLQISIFILNCLCLLFWQFSQFIFLTQVAIFFFMEQLRVIDAKALSIFLHSHFCGLHMAVLLLQGNDMLKTSLYTSYFLAVSVYCLFFSTFRVKVQNRWDLLLELFLIALRMAIVLFVSLCLKKAISDFLAVQEDSHIWEVLYSKLTPYKTFHTLIYTCSDVFDFLPWRSVRAMLVSFLIPVTIMNSCNFFNTALFEAVWRSEARGQPQPAPELMTPPASQPTTDTGSQSVGQQSTIQASQPPTQATSQLTTEPTNQPPAKPATEDTAVESNAEAQQPAKSTLPVDSVSVSQGANLSKPSQEDTSTAAQEPHTANSLENQTATSQENPSTTSRENLSSTSQDPLITSEEMATSPEPPVDSFITLVRCFEVDPAAFYNILQMMAFGLMAALVMRFKLLLTTHMCLITSLVTAKTHFYLPLGSDKYVPLLWLLLTAPSLRVLFHNMNEETAYIGEFNDYPQEELMQWIGREAGGGAFAGSMPVLATVMLTTRKPIVVHPHYEHLETRQRAYAVYKVYGRFKAEELYQELKKLEASYLIVERKYCYGRSDKNCTFGEIWDAQEPSLSHRPLLCHTLLSEPVEHFYLLFKNSEYAVFRVHDVSVRYMPRCFDT